jgi:hypothetical protein
LGLGLAALVGCQTNDPVTTGNMTLPSPRYLEHAPTYVPPSPPYPYIRELSSMQAAAAAADTGAGPAVALPPRVPAGPVAP